MNPTARIALVAAACLATATGAALATASPHQVVRGRSGVPAHVIDWDHPVMGGIVVRPDVAQAKGALPFRPLVPSFAVAPTRTMVSDPASTEHTHRSFGMLFTFPVGTAYPLDGRVAVTEMPSQVQGSALAAIAAHDAKIAPDHFRYLTLARGVPAILVQDHGVGRVHLVVHGVGVDITGPATSPEAVVALAQEFARQLG